MSASNETDDVAQNRWNSRWDLDGSSIPKERYTAREFLELENRKLWPHVWQMACRLDEIPDRGDYAVYEIADQSILVVRVNEVDVKAYHNACRHRGTLLATGSGRFPSGEITCPFHGWRWKLDGTSSFVLDREEFRRVCPKDEDLALRECQVGSWLGCVFINMDLGAPPLEEHTAPIRSYLDPLLIDQMHFRWHRSVVIPANWKVTLEVFLEAYHVPTTHAQLDYGQGSQRPHRQTSYQVFPNGHGAFKFDRQAGESQADEGGLDELESLIRNLSLLAVGTDAMALPEDVLVAEALRKEPIPAGSSAGAEFIRALYERAAKSGRPLPDPDPETVLSKWGGECFVFPNYAVLPQFGNALVYRSRPNGDDPDTCIFDVWSIRTYAQGETVPPALVEQLAMEDADSWGLIALQDFANLPKIQKGMHSRGFKRSILSDRQEITIVNLHRELSRYLKA